MSPETDNRSKLLDLKANNSIQEQRKGQEGGTVKVETDNFMQIADRNGQGERQCGVRRAKCGVKPLDAATPRHGDAGMLFARLRAGG